MPHRKMGPIRRRKLRCFYDFANIIESKSKTGGVSVSVKYGANAAQEIGTDKRVKLWCFYDCTNTIETKSKTGGVSVSVVETLLCLAIDEP
jgi:hypothetical protein